jgi:hypothetical protein
MDERVAERSDQFRPHARGEVQPEGWVVEQLRQPVEQPHIAGQRDRCVWPEQVFAPQTFGVEKLSAQGRADSRSIEDCSEHPGMDHRPGLRHSG